MPFDGADRLLTLGYSARVEAVVREELGIGSNIVAFLPYGFGHIQGNVNGTRGKVYRSGLLDAVFRFSVNLKGGPAMSPQEFRSWRQKTLIGTSLTLVAPTGQYDPTRIINRSSSGEEPHAPVRVNDPLAPALRSQAWGCPRRR